MNEEKETLTSQVIDVVAESTAFFHDQDSNGYAIIKRNGHREALRMRSKEFSDYLSHVAWEELGRPLVSTAKETVLATLEAMARFEGKRHELHIRTAWHKGSLWYDLGRKAVRINESGWEVVEKIPILFKKFPHQEPQVEPVRGGEIEDILKYLNIPTGGKERGETGILVLTYLVSVLIPDIPRPIMAIHGLPGAAKSTFLRVVKNLIDPSMLETMTYPRNSQDLIQMLSHHFMICFDNLSELDDWQSDELCKAVTGQAFSKRMLFTDDDDVMYCYKRAIGLNGINLVATKSDLLDRSLIFELQPISREGRISEESFWIDFEKEKPKLIGAIFSVLSKAMDLKKRGLVKLEKKPRLADYAVWSSAASMAMGHTIEYFTEALRKNIERQSSEAIDASPIAQVIIDYMSPFRSGGETRQTSKQLFDELKKRAKELGLDKDKDFPKTQGWLWRKIKPVKANLQNIGIEVEYRDNVRPRQILLRKTDKSQEDADNDVRDVKVARNQDLKTTKNDSMTIQTSFSGNPRKESGPEEQDAEETDKKDIQELTDDEYEEQPWSWEDNN